MLPLMMIIAAANVACGYWLATYLGRIEREIVVVRPRLPRKLAALATRFRRKPAA